MTFIFLTLLGLNLLFTQCDSDYSKTNQFPIAMAHLLSNKLSTGEFPIPLTKTGYLLYDLRKATFLTAIDIKLSSNTCKRLKLITISLSNSTKNKNFKSFGFKNCENSKVLSENTRIIFENVGFARFVRIGFKAYGNSGVDVGDIDITKVKLFTNEPLLKLLKSKISPKITTKNGKHTITNEPNKVRKISLILNDDVNFDADTVFPKLEILFKFSHTEQPQFVKCASKRVLDNNSIETVLPANLILDTIRIKGYNLVKEVKFYKEGTLHRAKNEGEDKELTEKTRIMRLVFTDKEKGQAFFSRMTYGKDGETKTFLIYGDNPIVDVDIEVDSVKIYKGKSSEFKNTNVEIYTSPCMETDCLNGGVCVIDSEFALGYGCVCDRGFAGDSCEDQLDIVCTGLETDSAATFERDSYYEDEFINYMCSDDVAVEGKLICKENGLFDVEKLSIVARQDLC